MARAASLLLLLVANALPLMALLSGEWAAGDVLIAFWLENVAIGLWAALRIATSSMEGLRARRLLASSSRPVRGPLTRGLLSSWDR